MTMKPARIWILECNQF